MERAFEFEDYAIGDFYWKERSDFYAFGLCVCFDGDLFHIIGIAVKVAVGTDFVYHHCSDSPYFLLVEILFGFSRKAEDYIGCDRDWSAKGPNFIYKSIALLCVIATEHFFQHWSRA